jgi:hypothetical protein
MLGTNHEHVAAIPFRDHLLLEVLRGVLAAHELLERAAQAIALLPEAIADAAQLSTRVIEHFTRCIDGTPHCADFLFEAGDAGDDARQDRKRSGSVSHRASRLLD